MNEKIQQKGGDFYVMRNGNVGKFSPDKFTINKNSIGERVKTKRLGNSANRSCKRPFCDKRKDYFKGPYRWILK